MQSRSESVVFCPICGNNLQPDAAFCGACGAALPVVEDTHKTVGGVEKRSGMMWSLIAAAVVLSTGIGGWLVANQLGPNEDEPQPVPTLEPQPVPTPPVPIATTVATVDLDAICGGFIAAVANATADLLAGLAVVPFDALDGQDASALIATYEASVAAAAGHDDVPRCDPAGRDAAYAARLEAVLDTPSGVLAQAVLAETLPSSGIPITGAFKNTMLYLYDRPPITPVAETENLPAWISIMASLPTSSWTETAARLEADRMARPGVEMKLLRSDDFGSLNNGYWVVYAGVYGSRSEARSFCTAAREAGYGVCYDRYLQQLPSAAEPFVGCGEWGSHRVIVGSADVHTGPTIGHNTIGSLTGNTTGVLSAGPSLTTDGELWTPVGFGVVIGWVQASQLDLESKCVGVRSGYSVTTCTDISDYALDSRVQSLEHAESNSLQSSTPPTVNPDWEAYLVRRASMLGCDVEALNRQITAELGSLNPTTGLATAVLALFQTDPFFTG